MLKRRTLLLALSSIVFCVVAARLAVSGARPVFCAVKAERPVYVLDAGHGGEDGGAVSADGVKESDVNLAIARELNTILHFLGQNTVLTRDADVSIYSDGAETLRQKKASDLKNRVALANGTPNAVLVSIHQNSLPSAPDVYGAQVFHGVSAAGERYASFVQAALNQSVNRGNEKCEKRIDPSIYLMKHVTCPAILIECGFLSNRAECEKLQKPTYQKKLAVAVAAGLLNTEESKLS